MPGPAGQHTLILQQEPGYEKGNGAGMTGQQMQSRQKRLKVWSYGGLGALAVAAVATAL